MVIEEFKPKVLNPGDKYLVYITEQAFFKDDFGKYQPAKERKRIEIREKRALNTEESKTNPQL